MKIEKIEIKSKGFREGFIGISKERIQEMIETRIKEEEDQGFKITDKLVRDESNYELHITDRMYTSDINRKVLFCWETYERAKTFINYAYINYDEIILLGFKITPKEVAIELNKSYNYEIGGLLIGGLPGLITGSLISAFLNFIKDPKIIDYNISFKFLVNGNKIFDFFPFRYPTGIDNPDRETIRKFTSLLQRNYGACLKFMGNFLQKFDNRKSLQVLTKYFSNEINQEFSQNDALMIYSWNFYVNIYEDINSGDFWHIFPKIPFDKLEDYSLNYFNEDEFVLAFCEYNHFFSFSSDELTITNKAIYWECGKKKKSILFEEIGSIVIFYHKTMYEERIVFNEDDDLFIPDFFFKKGDLKAFHKFIKIAAKINSSKNEADLITIFDEILGVSIEEDNQPVEKKKQNEPDEALEPSIEEDNQPVEKKKQNEPDEALELFICKKCGSNKFEYDEYFDETCCGNCGWTEKGKL